MAIRLTRTSSQCLSRTTDLLDYQSDFTIALWFYFVSNPGAGNNMNICQIFRDDNNVDTVGTNGTTFKTEVYRGVNGSTAVVNGATLSTGTWYHGALVGEAATLKFYLNGSLDCTASLSRTGRSGAATYMHVGRYGTLFDYADGRFYAIKAWSLALTLADVQNEMYAIRPVVLASLYGWWPGFAGSGERTRDYGGTARDWTAVGTLTDEDPPPVS